MLFLSPSITAILLTFAAVLGAVMGSFLNCAAWRLVHKESILRGRSHCALCNHPLGALDLIPIVSYLTLKGRCRYCGKPISPRYPLAEAALAFVYSTLLLRFDVGFQCLRFWVLMSALLLAALTDLEDGWIPDRAPVTAAVLYFPIAFGEGGVPLLLEGLLGAAALFLPMLAVVLAMERVMKTEVMGGGDLKLFAVLGLYFGWQQGLFLVLVSCVLGLAAMALSGRLKRRTQTRFAPILFLSAYLNALTAKSVITWYLGLF